jgi:phage-related protein
MKHSMGMSLIAVVLGLAMLIGCGEKADQAAQDVKKGVKAATEAAKEMGTAAKETVESTAAATKEKMDAYLGDMKGQLENLDSQFEDLGDKVGVLGDSAKEKYKDQLAAFSVKKEAVAAKMEEMKGLSGDAWEKAKQELDQMMGELTQSYENIKKGLIGA